MEGRLIEAVRFLTYPYYFLTMTILNSIYILQSKVYRVRRKIKAQYPLHPPSNPLQPKPHYHTLPTYQNIIKKRNKNIYFIFIFFYNNSYQKKNLNYLMISQFFILSLRGDVIINRDFRSDLVKTTQEIFYRNVKLYKGNIYI